MKTDKILYKDVINYSPIDVIKGIDLITKEIVLADDPAPTGYKAKPKCRFCKNFLTDNNKAHLGTCKASSINFMAYPDMTATTCKDYDGTDI